MEEPVPTRLGKYEVAEELNRGSMGIVYLGYATSPKTNRQYKNFSVFIADDNEEEGEGND